MTKPELPTSSREEADDICPRTYFAIYRGYIEQEHSLINSRLQWNLTIQGFLFAAWALFLKPPDHAASLSMPPADNPLVRALPWLGTAVSVLTLFGVNAAQVAVINLNKKWRRHFGPKSNCGSTDDLLPRLAGGGSAWAHAFGNLWPVMIPFIVGPNQALLFSSFVHHQELNRA